MESRPAPLRSRRVCRFCLTESEPLNFIYERDHHSRPFNVPLTLQIMSCVSIEVYSADGMPQMICNNCRWNLDRSYKFKQQCKKADEALRAYPMTGTLPRPFPSINAGDKSEFIGGSGGSSCSSNIGKRGVDRDRDQQQQTAAKKSRVDNGDQQQSSAPPTPAPVTPRPRGRPPRQPVTPSAVQSTPATPKVERSDSNYRVSRSISEGEKKRPEADGQSRRRRNKGKIDTESDEEDDEDEPYSDGDDDYEPPSYVSKKFSKSPKREVLSKYDDGDSEDKQSDKKIIFVRNKEGKIVKKAIKTMLPIQQQQQQQSSSSSPTSPPSSQNEAAETRPSTRTSAGSQRSNIKVVHNQNKTINDESSTNDVTEAEVQKIVASVFKEHKIPLKQANIPQEQVKETTAVSTTKVQTMQTIKKEKIEASSDTSTVVPVTSVAALTPSKSVNTVKVIKRVVVRKPTGGAETTTTTTTTTKDGEPIKTTTTSSSSSATATGTTATTGTKVKRTIIRRIIRQGDTTREILLNADGTPLDPAELAKLSIRKQVVVKKISDKTNNQTTQALQSSSSTNDKQQPQQQQQQKPQQPQLMQKKITTTGVVAAVATTDSPKFEHKTSQNKTNTVEKKIIPSTNVPFKKPIVVSNLQSSSATTTTSTPTATTAAAAAAAATTTTTTTTPSSVTKNNDAATERVLQLEKQLETQRLVIQKLQAKKQQEYETNDDMLPDRHDSEDEQELPLKRVFVKRKQSIYDEEREYHDNDVNEKDESQTLSYVGGIGDDAAVTVSNASNDATDATNATDGDNITDVNTTTATNDKTDEQNVNTDVFIKMEASSGVDDISRELHNILESTETVAKMQQNVLNNLNEISGLNDNENEKINLQQPQVIEQPEQVEKMQIDEDDNNINEKINQVEKQSTVDIENKEIDNPSVEQVIDEQKQQQNLNTTTDIFDNSDGSICQKNEQSMNDSVIALSQTNETINLNDTTDSQDSLEDKLSQMEG